MGFAERAPSPQDDTFAVWWKMASRQVAKGKKKGFNSIVILGAWLLWKQRNACVFVGASPNISILVKQFEDELHLWCMAGAKGLRALGRSVL